MSEKLKAQKRQGNNDTLHLYRENNKAYCDRRREADEDRQFIDLEDTELDEAYIIRDQTVVGKVCTNCRKAYRGVCHANE
jgi:hypothetical protein